MKLKYTLFIAALFFILPASAQQAEQPKIYDYVEAMPEAAYDYNKYLSENLHYPDSARMNNIQGRVVIKFVVNEDGAISDAKVFRGIGSGCA